MLIVCLFFLPHKIKTSFIYHLLIIMFLSQFMLPFRMITMNAAAGYIILIACFLIARLALQSQFYIIIASVIVGLCQSCFIIFMNLEPLWFQYIPVWGSGILLLYVSILLLKESGRRMLSLIMGMVISDLLLFIVHIRNGLPYEALSLSWLDQLAVVTLLFFVWYVFEEIGHYLFAHRKHMHKKEV